MADSSRVSPSRITALARQERLRGLLERPTVIDLEAERRKKGA
jgi:hypothetical protein